MVISTFSVWVSAIIKSAQSVPVKTTWHVLKPLSMHTHSIHTFYTNTERNIESSKSSQIQCTWTYHTFAAFSPFCVWQSGLAEVCARFDGHCPERFHLGWWSWLIMETSYISSAGEITTLTWPIFHLISMWSHCVDFGGIT